MLKVVTDIVVLAVLELAHGETTVKLEIAFEGLGRVATVVISTAFAEKSIVGTLALRGVLGVTLRVRYKVLVQHL